MEKKLDKEKSHRKRFSRRRFNQIMISNFLKHELNLLKPIVAKKINAAWNLSFCDVLYYLIDYYQKHPEPEVLPNLVVSGRKTVFNHSSIIIPKKEVRCNW